MPGPGQAMSQPDLGWEGLARSWPPALPGRSHRLCRAPWVTAHWRAGGLSRGSAQFVFI